jgi:hypothetical protein
LQGGDNFFRLLPLIAVDAAISALLELGTTGDKPND